MRIFWHVMRIFGVFGMGLLGVCVAFKSFAAAPSVQDYDAVPPLLSDNAKPMIMLALSKDHQMFLLKVY